MALGVSSLTYAPRPLVRDGLVALTPDPQDKRTHLLPRTLADQVSSKAFPTAYEAKD